MLPIKDVQVLRILLHYSIIEINDKISLNQAMGNAWLKMQQLIVTVFFSLLLQVGVLVAVYYVILLLKR